MVDWDQILVLFVTSEFVQAVKDPYIAVENIQLFNYSTRLNARLILFVLL